MSVLQPISYGLVHQVGPGTGGRGFGSYKADNTELIRPYQQESSSPIGRGYPMSVVSGRPTVYDPNAGVQEDPVVMLLKQLLGEKKVVEKAPDAGFRSNEQVYTTSEAALELPGRTLGAAPADRGLGGGGGGNVVVGRAMFQNIEVPDQRGYLDIIVQRLSDVINSGSAAIIASSAFGARQMTAAGIPMTPSLAYDATIRQIEQAFRNYLPAGTSDSVIGASRAIVDLITSMDRYREDMVALGERGVSDYVYRPIQAAANRGLEILVTQARSQLEYYGEVSPITIAEIVDTVSNNPLRAMGAMTIQAVILTVIAVLNPGRFRHEYQAIRNRAQGGGLRMNPAQRQILNIASF